MAAALEDLLQRHPVWRGGRPAAFAPVVPTGYDALDEALPGGGWPTRGLTEVLAPRAGCGELQLVLPALASLSWARKRAVWLAPPHLPYAPALAAAGVDLAQLTVVSAPGRRDALWAAEQVLRGGGCHALLAWFRKASFEELRRLAVAAEAGHAWIALFRPPEAAAQPSPACLRIALEPQGGALSLRILKRRGAPAGAPLRLPLRSSVHALGRTSLPPTAAGRARADRGLGLPVHA